ncbi:MAG: hypothetical protein H7A37_09550 [Chlamydiales bacterium]|nr:hypothetical protein [Chlamydiia bacterium]MCP5508522.1 hypothetical protein [Chlamydiales bacterium]
MRPDLKISICIVATALTLYAYIDKQNQLTELKRTIPKLEKEVRTIRETNIRLHYDIDRFESPLHLMELARKPEYGHLRYPYVRDVLMVPRKKEEGGE